MHAVLRVVEQLVIEGRAIAAHDENVAGVPPARFEMRADRFEQEHEPFVEDEVLRIAACLLRQKFLDPLLTAVLGTMTNTAKSMTVPPAGFFTFIE